MSTHTKEPWKVAEYTCHAMTTVMSADGRPIAETTGFGRMADECEIDARRIVACVNACAGIPTDVLEDTTILKASRDILNQRDELLAAAKKFKEHQSQFDFGDDVAAMLTYAEFVRMLDAAIAKAEAVKC